MLTSTENPVDIDPKDRDERRRFMLEVGSLERILELPRGSEVLDEETKEPDPLVTREALRYLLALQQQRRTGPAMVPFLDFHDVIIVPGFMGSTLVDRRGPHGLIWIDPRLLISNNNVQLSALRLAAYDPTRPDRDADAKVRVEADDSLPLIYDLLALDLRRRLYAVSIFPIDWRKDLERSAVLLADRIRNRQGRRPRPLHLIAHSQGALVARRALQIAGADVARRLVSNLVLLGPANFGTFSAAYALAGDHESIHKAVRNGIHLPDDFEQVLQSFTGLYQLLPWDKSRTHHGFDPEVTLKAATWWKSGADSDRLRYGFGWGRHINTTFFDDRTTIILGEGETTGAVEFNATGQMVRLGGTVLGDGTVPDTCARLDGVRTYRAGADHMMLPMNLGVLFAVAAILRGDNPSVERVAVADAGVKRLRQPTPPSETTAAAMAPVDALPVEPPPRPAPPAPNGRKLRVFSFDPLLATRLSLLNIAEIAIEVPWERDGQLGVGPVGEYVEVVDYDPASNCFYHAVDLAHPRLVAQSGLPPSQSDPQFHQQMTYAVAMATIGTFEKALGRVALWAPRLERDAEGNLVPMDDDERFVPRLRVYPHALREANAFYDPDKHALLFGYFPSREQPGGNTPPGATVFTCLSFDVVAHETTHALLHGLHRHFLHPSNPDVFAFHEAFADAVALFQHFSHPEVLRDQVARTRGDLRRDGLLGRLAQQFGEALGHRKALRDYLILPPDPTWYATRHEPHDRGSILMAALFRAFLNIYEQRTEDLYRIATGGTGKLPDGAIHPDLVNRLAVEAGKSARHLLQMCVRALDYVPPVDLTFGEYLRALITADWDLVRDDDRRYRVSVIEAFRSWGLYPDDIDALDESALRWHSPDFKATDRLRDVIHQVRFDGWDLRADRRDVFRRMQADGQKVHQWLREYAAASVDGGASIGICLDGDKLQSVPRGADGVPRFEVHSLRPCHRVGPDGQQRIDLVAEIVQRRAGFFDDKRQQQVDQSGQPWAFSPDRAKDSGRLLAVPDFWFRGGCTLVIDPHNAEVRYCIRKSIRNDDRLARQRKYERTGALPSLGATYFGMIGRNPFAMLHGDD